MLRISSGQHLKDLRTIIKNNLKQDLEFKVQLTSENGETYSSGLQIVSTKELLESQSSLIKLALKNLRIKDIAKLLPRYQCIDFKDVRDYTHQIQQLDRLKCYIEIYLYWEDSNNTTSRSLFGYAIFDEEKNV